MPELPEVEGFRAVVERHALDRTVVRARALDDWMLKEATPRVFARRLNGRTITSVERRGKMLLAFTRPRDHEPGPPVLVLHFGMTGHPVVTPTGAPAHPWDRLILTVDSGEDIRYRNSRRLGFIRAVPRTELTDLLWGLGPDPLEAPVDYVRETLAARRAPVKAVLLDQGFLAGVGNIYADEALLAARIHPGRSAASLGPDEVAVLYRTLRSILRRAVKAAVAGRDIRLPLLDLREEAARNLAVNGHPSVPCPSCGGHILAGRFGGRTAYYCPRCQR